MAEDGIAKEEEIRAIERQNIKEVGIRKIYAGNWKKFRNMRITRKIVKEKKGKR